VVQKLGSYVGEILGTMPHDVVGLLVGDWLRARRMENASRIFEKTKSILEDRGIDPADEQCVSPRLGVPYLESASLESDDELQDVWARLMANAMDPNTNITLRQEYIETLREFEPIDALVLSAAAQLGPTNTHVLDISDLLETVNKVAWDHLAVSLANLHKLSCVETVGSNSRIEDRARTTPLGRELIRAVSQRP
ncbi:MAG: Abi-alpha family protein, partial [Haliea sp.]